MNETKQDILKRDWSNDFIEYMQNRIIVSHYKYGWMNLSYPDLADAIASLEKRLELYKKTGNKEWLVDVANFAMIEFMYPKHKDAHFRATDSNESPGLVGISYNEMMAEVEND